MLSWLLTFFEEFRQSFRIADAVDIAIIAIVLYSLLIWFKQTASRGVVVGITLLTALYFVARSFDMYLTSLVFHTAFAVLVVVLVVVFQEEICRVLERVAHWGTLRGLRQPAPHAVEVDTMVEATFTLAENKTGALLVIRGREALERHIDGGIVMDGQISKPLLYSIFDSSSPGHDGAVIVHKGRLEKFAAHLPISKNHAEIRGRGTRHSAALGLSECSDALVTVVSEERGVVSVAEDGKLTEVKSTAVLKDRLEQFLEEKFPQTSEVTWKRLLARHWRLKVAALMLAFVAWLVLAFDVETVQTSLVVPIEYRNVPANTQIDQFAPTQATIWLSGTERAFRLLDRRVVKVSIDLKHATNGDELIPITADHLQQLPPSLKLDRVQPNIIQVELKR